MADAAQNGEPWRFSFTSANVNVVHHFVLKKMLKQIENQSWEVTDDIHDDNRCERHNRVGGVISVNSNAWMSQSYHFLIGRIASFSREYFLKWYHGHIPGFSGYSRTSAVRVQTSTE